MKKHTLDLESIAVETFATGPRVTAEVASISRWCTLYDTCTNCPQDSCIC